MSDLTALRPDRDPDAKLPAEGIGPRPGRDDDMPAGDLLAADRNALNRPGPVDQPTDISFAEDEASCLGATSPRRGEATPVDPRAPGRVDGAADPAEWEQRPCALGETSA